MFHCRLPKFMLFNQADDLIRLGGPNDGGYLVSQADIQASDHLISLGISDDWSFEKSFLAINKVDLLAFDNSISFMFFIKKCLKNLIRIDRPNIAFRYLSTAISYYLFFSQPNVEHRKLHVGTRTTDGTFVSLEDIDFNDHGYYFLKIDIEGSEYRILDDILRIQHKLSGLVIEFHDCDLHMNRIKKFIEELVIKIKHIHVNNFAPVNEDSKLPHVIEVTFGRRAACSDELSLPHPLDSPNNAALAESAIQFEELFSP